MSIQIKKIYLLFISIWFVSLFNIPFKTSSTDHTHLCRCRIDLNHDLILFQGIVHRISRAAFLSVVGTDHHICPIYHVAVSSVKASSVVRFTDRSGHIRFGEDGVSPFPICLIPWFRLIRKRYGTLQCNAFKSSSKSLFLGRTRHRSYEAFTEYSTYGGLPLVLSKKRDSDKSKYLRDNLKETYIKDIVERHHLQGDVVMDTLVEILPPPEPWQKCLSGQQSSAQSTLSCHAWSDRKVDECDPRLGEGLCRAVCNVSRQIQLNPPPSLTERCKNGILILPKAKATQKYAHSWTLPAYRWYHFCTNPSRTLRAAYGGGWGCDLGSAI